MKKTNIFTLILLSSIAASNALASQSRDVATQTPPGVFMTRDNLEELLNANELLAKKFNHAHEKAKKVREKDASEAKKEIIIAGNQVEKAQIAFKKAEELFLANQKKEKLLDLQLKKAESFLSKIQKKEALLKKEHQEVLRMKKAFESKMNEEKKESLDLLNMLPEEKN